MIIRKIESNKERRKQLVAAYARVSTDTEQQQMSFDMQVGYYASYIQQNPIWEFAGVYADDALSATSANHRPEFQRMIADATDGKN